MGSCYTRESGRLVLADGMGGHPEGEVAAQLAMQTIFALYQKEARPTVKDTPAFLSNELVAAHHQIVDYASQRGMRDSPRTALIACVLQGTGASWVHCGDSRLYLVRDAELLTRPPSQCLTSQAHLSCSREIKYYSAQMFCGVA